MSCTRRCVEGRATDLNVLFLLPQPIVEPQVTGKTFMPLPKCSTEQCSLNKVQGRLQMQVSH